MNRRSFCQLTALGAILDSSCAGQRPEVFKAVEEMAHENQLAIIAGGLSIFDPGGAACGRIRLPKDAFDVKISPDGESVAWCRLAPSHPASEGYAFWTDVTGQIKSIRFDGSPSAVAVSSKTRKIVVRLSTNGRFQLIFIDVASGAQSDLTPPDLGIDLRRLERMGISGQGDRLVISSGGTFIVIDASTRNVLLHRRGYTPSVSPDGMSVAFTEGHDLYLHNIATGSERKMTIGRRTESAGGWSPDGRFLLAGGRTQVSLFDYRLIAVDVAADAFADLMRQEGEMSSEHYWIRRQFCV
jgi:hypothetical protein